MTESFSSVDTTLGSNSAKNGGMLTVRRSAEATEMNESSCMPSSPARALGISHCIHYTDVLKAISWASNMAQRVEGLATEV